MMYKIILMLLLGYSPSILAAEYQRPLGFLQEHLSTPLPSPKVLWISGEVKEVTEKILQHAPTSIRTRYWQQGKRSAWILEETGKEKPITVGIIINADRIEKLKVLAFRENRGWEVRHSYFTDQFKQARLDNKFELSKPIDGITGATLSVRALYKIARLALYYHQQVYKQHDSP